MDRGGLGERARYLQRQVVAARDIDGIGERQVATDSQPHVRVIGDSAGGRDGRRGPRRIAYRAHAQVVDIRITDRSAVIGGDRGDVVGAVVEVHRARTEELQAGGADRGGLSDGAGDVQRQVISTGDGDQITNGQVAAGGEADVGVVGEAAGSRSWLGRVGDGAD